MKLFTFSLIRFMYFSIYRFIYLFFIFINLWATHKLLINTLEAGLEPIPVCQGSLAGDRQPWIIDKRSLAGNCCLGIASRGSPAVGGLPGIADRETSAKDRQLGIIGRALLARDRQPIDSKGLLAGASQELPAGHRQPEIASLSILDITWRSRILFLKTIK